MQLIHISVSGIWKYWMNEERPTLHTESGRRCGRKSVAHRDCHTVCHSANRMGSAGPTGITEIAWVTLGSYGDTVMIGCHLAISRTYLGKPRGRQTLFHHMQGVCRCCLRLQRLLLFDKWMSTTNRNINYPRHETKNRWPSVDTHIQNGAVTMLLTLMRIKAANISVMHSRDQITV